MGMTPAGTRITYINPDDVASAIARAVDEPRAMGKRIDLGCDRALSGPELAELLEKSLDRKLQLIEMPGRDPDMTAMLNFFRSGKYVADTKLQGELFGPIPKVDESVRRMLSEFGLLSKKASA